MMKIEIDNRMFNPVFYHIDKYMNDNDVRTVLVYGGSSSSKTFSILQWIILKQIEKQFNADT